MDRTEKMKDIAPVKDFKNFVLPDQEMINPGHLACPGCGAAINMRMVMRVLGPETVVVIPACCWAVIEGMFPYTALKVPSTQAAFETAAITASGIRAALDVQGKEDINVIAFAGDGGTFDIGIQALSGAAERNDNIIYFCYDNEAYMNTGIQRSSATPWGSWTTTTPTDHPKDRPKKNIVDILAAHRIPYIATGSIAYPDDLTAKLEKAKNMKGTRFFHLFSSCPPGHKMEEKWAVKQSRLAVQSRVFPLIEVENGLDYRITVDPDQVPVTEYMKLQGRFKHLNEEDINKIQETVDFEWNLLLKKCRRFRD